MCRLSRVGVLPPQGHYCRQRKNRNNPTKLEPSAIVTRSELSTTPHQTLPVCDKLGPSNNRLDTNPSATPIIIVVLKGAVGMRPYPMFRYAYGTNRIRVIIVSTGETINANNPVAAATLPLLGGPGHGRPKVMIIP